jgi:gas vesicle protein
MNTKVIAGVIAGVAVVAAVGLLMNSEKGSEIKEEISDYFADLVNSIKEKVQSTSNNVASLKDDAIKAAKSAMKNKTDMAAEAVPTVS